MSVRFLGSSSQYNGSPTLYLTDRRTYVVQGWKVDGDETTIEIPHRLLAYLEPGTCLNSVLQDTGRGTFLLSGAVVSDAEVLAAIEVPGHERCVEVAVGVEIRPDDVPLAQNAR